MQFRMIRFCYFDAFMNMALDEAIMEGVRSGKTLPTIRFYGWKPSAISIGYFQGLRNEVNLEACRKAGVDVVRRMTGGGAVYHDMDGEVTYSIIGPLSIFPSNIIESYQFICSDLISALETLGIKAHFQPINDIMVEEQKISGNAQTRRGGVLLQHGTILYAVDVEKMFTLLNVDEVKVSDKLIKSVKKRVTSIKAFTDQPIEKVNQALEEAFSQGREIIFGDYSAEEMSRAHQLAKEKYRTDAWVAMR
jgi:lipoate-protein ligase A